MTFISSPDIKESFDMDLSNTSLAKILDKIQQLAEAENEVLIRQQEEIERLKMELVRKQSGCSQEQYEDQLDEHNIASSGSYNASNTKDSFEQQLKRTTQQPDENELSPLAETKSNIHSEVLALRNQVSFLVEQRTTLIKEVQVYSHINEVSDELADATKQITQMQHQMKSLQSQLELMAKEKEAALDSLNTQTLIRKELEKEMNILYREKIGLECALQETKNTAQPSNDGHMERLKQEIVLMKAENESLRVSAIREAATIQGLEDEIRSLNQAASMEYEPRGRLNSAENSSGDNSATHENDNVSILFGQNSISRSVSGSKRSDPSVLSVDDASDHKGIRVHAEKLLYWANKATERDKSPSIDSLASGSHAKPSTTMYHSSVPTTIGLPPRVSSSKKPRNFPPRPPSDTASIGNATNKSDKENGGSTFNVSKRSTNKAVIFNLDKVQSNESCCCSQSLFSGNDAHSEFYLPKLGLACACGQSSILDDRASFSKNPTGLQNILRKWQCDFLATCGVYTADQLLKAHKSGANEMARRMKRWRENNNLPMARSKECYVALMVWSRTAKVVLRSIEKQKEAGEDFIEKPGFLDITYPDTYTVGTVSTLGQMSSVEGRAHEMMEI